MATLSAARYNPAIKAFYDRLRAVGKPLKVARRATEWESAVVDVEVVTRSSKPFLGHRERSGGQGTPLIRGANSHRAFHTKP